MSDTLLLCTDLDRTLLPNGPAPESPGAREAFGRLAAHPGLTLAYVTGRHRALVEEAVGHYGLPRPAHVIGDVGTRIFTVREGQWHPWDSWQERLRRAWHGHRREDVEDLLADMTELRLPESEKQGPFKVSYYGAMDLDEPALLARVGERLARRDMPSELIWSVDENGGLGLLDVLPPGTSKLTALRHLMAGLEVPLEHTLFAGDSGNDMAVLTSDVPAVLVANARQEIRERARRGAAANGCAAALYAARGGFHGMNGNYAAGILEGLAHFHPHTVAWWSAS